MTREGTNRSSCFIISYSFVHGVSNVISDCIADGSRSSVSTDPSPSGRYRRCCRDCDIYTYTCCKRVGDSDRNGGYTERSVSRNIGFRYCHSFAAASLSWSGSSRPPRRRTCWCRCGIYTDTSGGS